MFNIVLLLKFEIKNKNSFHIFIQKEDLHIHTSCIRGTETTLSNLSFQCLSSTKSNPWHFWNTLVTSSTTINGVLIHLCLDSVATIKNPLCRRNSTCISVEVCLPTVWWHLTDPCHRVRQFYYATNAFKPAATIVTTTSTTTKMTTATSTSCGSA